MYRNYVDIAGDRVGTMVGSAFTTAGGLFGLAIAVVFYVLQALGLYGMAKNRGNDHAWFAWIPFLNLYLLGELTGNYMWGMEGSKWILPLAPLVIGVISMIPFIGWIVGLVGGIAYPIYFYMVLYKLYRMYQPNRATLYIILSIFFGTIAVPIIFFLMRNNRPQYLR